MTLKEIVKKINGTKVAYWYSRLKPANKKDTQPAYGEDHGRWHVGAYKVLGSTMWRDRMAVGIWESDKMTPTYSYDIDRVSQAIHRGDTLSQYGGTI